MTTTTFAEDFKYNDVTKRLSVDGVPSLLASATVDWGIETEQTIYTVPDGKVLIVTQVLVFNFSATPNDELFFGVSPGIDEMYARYQYTPGANQVLQMAGPASTGDNSFKKGLYAVAGDVLSAIMPTASTVPCTSALHVIGYLIDE